MSQACPTCNRPVDPLRARSVGVRDGKVVAYCSAECARAAETKPTKVPQPQPQPRTPASGVAQVSPAVDSGPVIEIVREPASSPVPIATRDEDDLSTRGAAQHDLQKLKQRAATEPVTRRSGGPLVLVMVVVLGGAGAFLAYQFLIANRAPTTQQAKPVVVADAAIADAPAPEVPAIDPAAAVAQARAVLAANVKSGTPRVRRVAAAALARTGDEAAIAALADALAREKTDVSKLDLAYALARAGDKRGFDALVAGLSSTRRDVKIQAGRLLALLGDQRAVPALAAFLDVSQLRLGAAEQLAYLAEARALKVLDQIRASADSSADDKARATIALGIAKRKEVVPDLHALLANKQFNVFAATALAQLEDPAAKPVLIEQLAIPSLRVEAARLLRRLQPTIDPRPHLPALVAMLTSNKDTEQVQVAEAILLLAGDVRWSERP